MAENISKAIRKVVPALVRVGAAGVAVAAIAGHPELAGKIQVATDTLPQTADALATAIGSLAALVVAFSKPIIDFSKLFKF